MTKGGTGGDTFSYKSEEEKNKTRKKLSEAGMGKNKGRKHSEKSRKNMSEAHKGKKLTLEQKRKISELHKGNTYTLGKKFSNETNKKKGRKGDKSSCWIPITEEMINDYNNNIKIKCFCEKYKVSGQVFNKVKQFLSDNKIPNTRKKGAN